jgi:hypothetical protein
VCGCTLRELKNSQGILKNETPTHASASFFKILISHDTQHGKKYHRKKSLKKKVHHLFMPCNALSHGNYQN